MTTQQLIEQALQEATVIAWDGCHKIYIALDEEQARQFGTYGYGEGGSVLLRVIQTDADRERAAITLGEWWDDSCSLRFINTVRTTPNPNDGYDNIVAQFDQWIEEPK
jgi:hypothetical protein